MNLRDMVSSYINKNGVNSMDELFTFLTSEIKGAIFITYTYMLISMFLLFVMFTENVVTLFLYERLPNLFYTGAILILGSIIYFIYKIIYLNGFSEIFKSYRKDYDYITYSVIDEELLKTKVIYLLMSLVKVLSSRTHTATYTIIDIILSHNSRQFNLVIR